MRKYSTAMLHRHLAELEKSFLRTGRPPKGPSGEPTIRPSGPTAARTLPGRQKAKIEALKALIRELEAAF